MLKIPPLLALVVIPDKVKPQRQYFLVFLMFMEEGKVARVHITDHKFLTTINFSNQSLSKFHPC